MDLDIILIFPFSNFLRGMFDFKAEEIIFWSPSDLDIGLFCILLVAQVGLLLSRLINYTKYECKSAQ